MAALRIPDHYQPGFKLLISISDEVFQALLAALSEKRPLLHLKELTDFISNEVVGIPRDDLKEITEVLISLYSLQDYLSITASRMVDSAYKAAKNVFQDLPDEELERFKTRLTELLRVDEVISAHSKANNVLLDHERAFMRARILTDIRPVFKSKVVEPPVGAVIVHMLKIEYREGDDRKEFFVALDTTDIRKLKEILERADLKGEVVKSLLNKADVAYLDVEES